MLTIRPDIHAALQEHKPVVALESTLISHGLPYPLNLETAQALEQAVRDGGAQPATIGVGHGVPMIGLDEPALMRFVGREGIRKLSRRDLGAAVAQAADGATTVAATMALAHLAGIAVFATGGIGGVHRGARESWDVSADLGELSRTPVLVVCAGAKAILDLPATLELLETLGVPVVGYGCDELPAFYSTTSGLPLTIRANTPAEVARIWHAHLQYGGGSGLLVCVPPPPEVALPRATAEAAIERALSTAKTNHIRGAAVTPFLLAAMECETTGESLRTNIALLRNNASIAAQIAVALVEEATDA
ncbi:MAG: pseudouridine-5'-phosphate glycosidase [Herpetosiphonaceae bacterium]|nr:pseudouridine-5'-phosphate glycosidase [Herpetosiphonaceae bacterium]